MAIHVHTDQDNQSHTRAPLQTWCPECQGELWDGDEHAFMLVCPACGWQAPADQPIDVTQFDEFWVDNESWRDYTNAAEL